MSKTRHMKKVITGISIASLLSGCIEIDPLVQGAPAKEQFPMQSCSYWGSAYRDRPYSPWADGGDNDHTLFSVRSKYNYWYAWVTVLSFGVLMPMDIEWKYNKDQDR